jgi:outer membrane immunogenic protein
MSIQRKSFLLGTVSCLALASAAVAADMPMKAPPVAAIPTWAGPYIGVNAGVAWHRWSFNDVDDQLFILPTGKNSNNVFWRDDRAAFTAGGQVGYNWQSGNVVYGLEADLNWVNGKSSFSFPDPNNSSELITASTKLEWLATIRGRLGITVSPPTLLYATGGVAFGGVKDVYGKSNVIASVGPAVNDKTLVGFAVGGGIEHQLSPNWSAKIEGLYLGFEKSNVSRFFSNNTYRSEFKHSAVLARIGLNRRFGVGN